jgi:hypothetical protein
MTRLILTSLSGFNLKNSGLADVVIPFTFRFVWGPLPSPDELAAYLAVRSDNHAAQSDPSLVGRHRTDQRPPLAMGPGESRSDRALRRL